MKTNLVQTMFVFVVLFVAQGCYLPGVLQPPKGGSYTYNEKSPYGSRNEQTVKDDFGRTNTTVNVESNVGALGGGFVGPASPMGGYHRPPAWNRPLTCYSTPSGQRICPQTDGVVPYTDSGNAPSPLATPNGRLESRVRRVENVTKNLYDREKAREQCGDDCK